MSDRDLAADLLSDIDGMIRRVESGTTLGAQGKPQASEPEAAAVLYLDVVGFTELSHAVSSERLATLIDRMLRLIGLEVERFGGQCDHVEGDAALYVFPGGADLPSSREAALLAGLAAMDRVGQIDASLRDQNLGLTIRIGIAFGEVAGHASVADVSVTGDAVALARRLEAAARPGTILTTWEVIAVRPNAFAWEDAGELEMAGIGPVGVFRITAVASEDVPARDSLEGAADLLADIATLTTTARAGVLVTAIPRLRGGELRPVAILYVEVAGFDALTSTLGPKVLATVLENTFQLFELDAQRYGGYRDALGGVTALYVFLGSDAHPPPAEAAIRAGLAILDRAERIDDALRRQGLALSVRGGVSFGEVTRRAVGGKQTVMGESVNLAQRLAIAAEAGKLLTVWPVLGGLEESFEWHGPEPLALKGLGTVETYRVLGAKPRNVWLRGGGIELTPLVGRADLLDETLETIRAWWRTTYPDDTLDVAATGKRVRLRGRLLVLAGPAAVGKSRVAWEVTQRLRDEDGVRLGTAHCLQTGGGLIGFASELASLGGLTSRNLPERFEALLASAADAVSDAYAERQRKHLPVLGLLLDSERVDTSGIRQADAKTFRLSTTLALRGLCELVHHESGRPIVLVVEDLQWLSDLDTLLADLLANTALHVPLIVIATARPEFAVDGSVSAACRHKIVPVDLFDEPLARALVDARLPGIELPERLWRDLLAKAQGLPYFLEEFAILLAERRHAERQPDGRWMLVRSVEALSVPEDVRTLVLARLDQLPWDLRALTGRASVLGRGFLARLLAAIEVRLEGHHPEALSGMLLRLIEQSVIQTQDLATPESAQSGSAPTADLYFFRHVLTRDAAYGSLLEHNRRLLHLLAAECLRKMYLEGSPGEVDAVAESAAHLERAGDLHAALQRLVRHIELLGMAGAHREADRQFEHALAIAEAVDWQVAAEHQAPPMDHISGHWTPSPSIAYVPSPPLDRPTILKAETLLILAMVRLQHGMQDSDSLGRNLAQLEHLRTHPVVRQSLGLRTQANYVLASMHNALAYVKSSDHEDHRRAARRILREALAGYESMGNRQGQARCLVQVGLAQGTWDLEEKQASFAAALAIYREIGHVSGEATVGAGLAGLEKLKGDYRSALEHGEAALMVSRDVGDRARQASILALMGQVSFVQGRFGEAHSRIEQALAIHREVGDSKRECVALCDLGRVHLRQGRLHEASTCQDAALELARRNDDTFEQVLVLYDRGCLEQLSGNMEEARTYLRTAQRTARDMNELLNEAIVLRQLARLDVAEGRLDKARERAVAALDALRQHHVPIWQALTLSELGDLERRRGDLRAAGRHLEEAEAFFESRGCRHELALTYCYQCRLCLELGDRASASHLLAGAESLAARMEVGTQSELGRLIADVEQAMGTSSA